MSNIRERLRAFPPGDGEGGLFHDAADEIDLLLAVIAEQAAEIERLRDALSVAGLWRDLGEENHRLKLEIERLQAEIARLRLNGCGTSYVSQGGRK